MIKTARVPAFIDLMWEGLSGIQREWKAGNENGPSEVDLNPHCRSSCSPV